MATKFLHDPIGIAHLDLKPDNIIIGPDYKIKLLDFGSCDDVRAT